LVLVQSLGVRRIVVSVNPLPARLNTASTTIIVALVMTGADRRPISRLAVGCVVLLLLLLLILTVAFVHSDVTTSSIVSCL